jgi:lysophospholipase L1-like esterase
MKKTLIITNVLTLILLAGITIYAFLARKHSKAENKKCTYALATFNYNHKNETSNPSIVMLGNSLIKGGNWDSLLNRKDIINRGIAGDRLHCICERLKYLDEYSPKICFVEGGINDIAWKQTDSLFEYYVEMVQYFRNRKILPVITCVLRISPKAETSHLQIKDYQTVNTDVDRLNAKLIDYAKKNNIDYINLNDELSDSASHVLKDKYTVDGVHLTMPAYSIWTNRINSILKSHGI